MHVRLSLQTIAALNRRGNPLAWGVSSSIAYAMTDTSGTTEATADGDRRTPRDGPAAGGPGRPARGRRGYSVGGACGPPPGGRRRKRVVELAREVGVTPSLISQIERGQSRPSVSTLFAMAQALEVPVDAFFREPA